MRGGTILGHQALFIRLCIASVAWLNFARVLRQGSRDKARATSSGMHRGRLHRTGVMVAMGFTDWEPASVSRGARDGFIGESTEGLVGPTAGHGGAVSTPRGQRTCSGLMSLRLCVGKKLIRGTGFRERGKMKRPWTCRPGKRLYYGNARVTHPRLSRRSGNPEPFPTSRYVGKCRSGPQGTGLRGQEARRPAYPNPGYLDKGLWIPAAARKAGVGWFSHPYFSQPREGRHSVCTSRSL